MKALTFTARFLTAQFKEHLQKATRRTYLIPPPSTVAGVFGAIMGLKLKKLYELSDKLLAGAKLLSLGGRIVTFSRTFKIDKNIKALESLLRKYYSSPLDKDISKNTQALLPIKESEELYNAEYKFAIASEDENLIEKGLERLENYDFEYDIFGGNDYHFVEFIGRQMLAEVKKSIEGYGYCPLSYFEKIETEYQSYSILRDLSRIHEIRHPIIIPTRFLANIDADYLQVYNAKITTNTEIDVADDGEDKIFIYTVKPFLIMHKG